MTLLGSFIFLRIMAGTLLSEIDSYIRYCFSCVTDASIGSVPVLLPQLVRQGVLVFLKSAGLLLLVPGVLATVATFAQTKLLISPEALKPKFSKINPIEGFKRLFSARGVVDTLKSILKITVLMILIYQTLTGLAGTFVRYLDMDVGTVCQNLFAQIFSMVMKIAGAFVILAGGDFLYQWWEYNRQMKMTKQEVKDEYKQTEGDPQVKSKIKSIQRKMSQSRMMQQVPQADVVIRNPTHYAVALRYKPEKDNAPIVLAKGQDSLALRIVKVAEEHKIHTIENVPLARALYAACELNREIPPDYYGAVAEVLAYLYRVDEKARKLRKQETPIPRQTGTAP